MFVELLRIFLIGGGYEIERLLWQPASKKTRNLLQIRRGICDCGNYQNMRPPLLTSRSAKLPSQIMLVEDSMTNVVYLEIAQGHMGKRKEKGSMADFRHMENGRKEGERARRVGVFFDRLGCWLSLSLSLQLRPRVRLRIRLRHLFRLRLRF